MSGHAPPDVLALVRQREAARRRKDYDESDRLREVIRAEGWLVTDGPTGSVLEPVAPFEAVDPARIANRLRELPDLDVSVHLLYEGYPDDLERFVRGLGDGGGVSSEVIVVDPATDDGAAVERICDRYGARAIHLDRPVGWAAARNAGLKVSTGRILVLADLSVEPIGDVLGPLVKAFSDQGVGLAGPFGLVTSDMRTFEPTAGPEADAIEGYLLAVRREHLAAALLRERFEWYRNADLDLSFQVRSDGARAVVVEVPVRKHRHRGWEAVPEPERTERSKRNHAIFYRRWRDRTDLTSGSRP